MSMRSASRRTTLAVLAALIVIAGIAVPRLLRDSTASTDDGLLDVTTTTGMIADLVANIGGDHVNVTSLMGPGVDPHLYKPSAGDVERLSDAEMIFYNGLHLEGRMTDIFDSLATSGKPTFPVAELIPEDRLRRPVEFEGNFDPHIWFDVTLWKFAAQDVADHLAAEDPTNAESYMSNRDTYLAKLDQLDVYIREQVATIPESGRVLITAHDAFGYFGQQYGLEVFGLQGTSTASEARANDVQDLARLIVDRQVKAIFVESSVPLATIEAVQAACKLSRWDVGIGGPFFSDAMGRPGTPEGTYIGMVRHNIDAIVRALR